MFIARSTPAFVIAYLALMVPTYILPYFGSNSAVVNAFSTALGMGPTPQWWAHVWCLTLLAVLGWLRGNAIGKVFLPVFPVLAAVFDLTPGLSMIPMVPTLLHLAAIIVGAMGTAVAATEVTAGNELILMRKAKIVTGLATLLAIGGSTLFAVTISRPAKHMTSLDKPSEAKATSGTIMPPIRQSKNVTSSDTAAAKDATQFVSPLPASAEPDASPQASTKAAPAASAAVPREAKHSAMKPHGDPITAREKPVNHGKPEVRYIRLND